MDTWVLILVVMTHTPTIKKIEFPTYEACIAEKQKNESIFGTHEVGDKSIIHSICVEKDN